ncbi:MAG: alpha/beta fold hydrolase [Bacteroidales bacterium]|nr:alpha/beta fold hydrolase [Bacteroidales bacterium]
MKMARYSYYIFLLLFSINVRCQIKPALSPKAGYVSDTTWKTWYKIVGEGDQTPIVMLHGGPGGISYFLLPLAELAKKRPVIFYDQYGNGHSYKDIDTSEMKVETYVKQLKNLIDELDLDKFYLYGHSWGTMLCLEYYLVYPDGIEGIIFNSPYFSTYLWIKDADTLISTLPDSVQIAIRTGEERGEYNTDA